MLEINKTKNPCQKEKSAYNLDSKLLLRKRLSTRPPAMGGCEPGQARDRAAISGYFHVPGVLVESRFFYGVFFELFYSPSWPDS